MCACAWRASLDLRVAFVGITRDLFRCSPFQATPVGLPACRRLVLSSFVGVGGLVRVRPHCSQSHCVLRRLCGTTGLSQLARSSPMRGAVVRCVGASLLSRLLPRLTWCTGHITHLFVSLDPVNETTKNDNTTTPDITRYPPCNCSSPQRVC